MFLDLNEYVSIYLLGCFIAFILLMFNTLFLWFLQWLTKANVVENNLKKLEPPNDATFLQKASIYIITLIIELSLSWISVLVQIWLTLTSILKILREVFTETPESIKLLRFPLKTNPNMTREGVWAHLMALQLVAEGRELSCVELVDSLNDIKYYYSTFEREHAVKQLKLLNTFSVETINATLSNLAVQEEDDTPWEED